MSGATLPLLHMSIWPGHEVDQFSLSSAEVKDKWNYASAPLYVYVACATTALPFFI
jgi:hypothetical protein